MTEVKLGEINSYSDKYDQTLLQPIPRQRARVQLASSNSFMGWDWWNAYEVSWLTPSGLPQVAIAEFAFSSESENIIESKSFKYYLNSFNQTMFETKASVVDRLSHDLAAAVNGEVSVCLFDLDEHTPAIDKVRGRCIDKIPCQIDSYQPNDVVLEFDEAQDVEQEQLYSHLLKSNCPVTGQPDWATIWLRYTGKKISELALLKYIVGFRQYQGFHESCVERIFNDIMSKGLVTELSVYARYTRRGGLDINPYRTNNIALKDQAPFGRTIRQ